MGSSEAPGSYRYIIRGVLLRPTGDNPRDDPPNYVPVDFGGGQGPKREVSWGRGAKDDPPNYVPVDVF